MAELKLMNQGKKEEKAFPGRGERGKITPRKNKKNQPPSSFLCHFLSIFPYLFLHFHSHKYHYLSSTHPRSKKKKWKWCNKGSENIFFSNGMSWNYIELKKAIQSILSAFAIQLLHTISNTLIIHFPSTIFSCALSSFSSKIDENWVRRILCQNKTM